MADQDVPAQFEAIFRKMFKRYEGPVHRGLMAQQVPGWDSLSHADLIMEVEDEMNVVIDPARAFDFPDLGALVDYVEEQRAAGA